MSLASNTVTVPEDINTSLFNQAPALIAIFSGREGRVELFNPQFKMLWGNRDVIGLTMREAWPELQGQGWFEMIEQVFETGKAVNANEYPAIADWDGNGKPTTAYFNFLGSPYKDADGNISKVLVLGFNVTEQVLQKKEYADKEAMMHLIINASPATKWISDETGYITFLSNRWQELTGIPIEEQLGAGWARAIHPEDRGQVVALYNEAIARQTSYETEFRVGRPDGTYSSCFASGNPTYNSDGKFIGFVGYVIDISGLKEVQKKVQESEAQFRQIADAMPQIVWTARPDGHADYWNRQWYEFTGLPESFGDDSWLPIIHPDDAPHAHDTWYKSVRSGTPYEIQYRFLDRTTGDYRWFLGRALPIRNDQGEIVKWFGTCTDIHQQKTTEEALETRVAKRTADLKDAAEKLGQSNEELEKFAYIASHDLQEPLRKIRFFTDLLQRELGTNLPEKAVSFMDRITNASERMMTLIDDLLSFSRLSRKEEKQPVRLNDILDDVTSDFDLLIQERNAIVQYTGLPTVQAVPQQMHQLFFNLMSNALKFIAPDRQPCVEIFAKLPENGMVEIVFSDNGIGFEAEYAERIFEVFERLNTRTDYAGTGIGLAVCRKIVTRHGGTIRAESTPDEGSTFYVTLPVESSL